eukprot:2034209-Alexandrium_andersonii.AAC.1
MSMPGVNRTVRTQSAHVATALRHTCMHPSAFGTSRCFGIVWCASLLFGSSAGGPFSALAIHPGPWALGPMSPVDLAS